VRLSRPNSAALKSGDAHGVLIWHLGRGRASSRPPHERGYEGPGHGAELPDCRLRHQGSSRPTSMLRSPPRALWPGPAAERFVA
jgi:hypothetical protein